MFNYCFECPECKKNLKFELEEEIVNTHSYERQMGVELEHEIYFNDTCSCGYEYSLVGSINEYPVGSYAYDNLEIS